MPFANFRYWKPGRDLPGFFISGLFPENPTKLGHLPVGARLVYRAKADWRDAVVSRRGEEKVTLIVSSPAGRTYRLSRASECEVRRIGSVIVLFSDVEDEWRENYAIYDRRW